MKHILKNSIFVLFIAISATAFAGTAQTVSAEPLSVSGNSVAIAETVTPEAAYTTSGTTLTLSVTNGSDITSALNEALAEATALASSDNIYTVKVPAGSYVISSCIRINSNTTLDLYDVNINSSPSAPEFCMLIFGDFAYTASSACAGYNGFKNITIQGGTFTAAPTHTPAPFLIMHAENVTLKDVTVGGGMADHLVESAAISNFMIDGCTFQNMSDSSTSNNISREALQFDLAVHDSIFPSCYQDGTMMKNVTVQNCTFNNVTRGLGTHSVLNDAYHENIKILNNTFTNVEKACIVASNYYNCEISGNKMTDCGGGIVFQFSKTQDKTIFTTTQNGSKPYKGTTLHDAKTVIKNNTIRVKDTGALDSVIGIKVAGRNIPSNTTNYVDGGTIPAGDYYISGVDITDNTIVGGGYGISLLDARNCNILRNNIDGIRQEFSAEYIKKFKGYGISLVEGSTGNKISENTIKNTISNGIHINENSGASEITSNTITAPRLDGISVREDSVITGNIASNVISDSGEHGITVNKSTIRGSVFDNRISGANMTGIHMYAASTVSGDIKNNTIKNSAIYGINVGDRSKTKGNITGNTVSVSGKTGIQIISKSSVLGNIDTNTVSDSKVNGITVTTNSLVDGHISSNTVTGSGKNGIYIYSSSTLGGSVKSNTTKASTTSGICVSTSSVVKGSIEKNTVSDSKKNGIQIIEKSSVNKKIASNTVTNSTVNGISILTSSKVKKGIENNTIKKAKKYGIYVYSKSTVKASITGNKISSCNTPIVVAPNCTVSIRKNTLSKNKNNYTKIVTAGIKVKTIKTPKFSSASGKSKKINMKWKKVKGVSGYYVELSTTADFKKVSKTIDTKSLKGVFKKLKKGKTYYIRISAYQGSGKARIYSNYSKVKKVKVS